VRELRQTRDLPDNQRRHNSIDPRIWNRCDENRSFVDDSSFGDLPYFQQRESPVKGGGMFARVCRGYGRRILIISSAALLAGCEHAQGNLMTQPDTRPLRIEVPDRDFRIPAEERARIVPDVDPDALERLLGMIRPDVRAEMLTLFQYPAPGERFAYLFELAEPELQAVLEEVWAPAWADVPDEVLDKGGLPHPGREIALRRREERKRRGEHPL
jgi:hypothetical protein